MFDAVFSDGDRSIERGRHGAAVSLRDLQTPDVKFALIARGQGAIEKLNAQILAAALDRNALLGECE
jgi:hypothetical protein